MSIATEITALTTDRDNIRTALVNKGVSASEHGFDDFATDIGNIPSGGTLQAKSVTYTENGTDVVTADAGYDGLSSVTVTTNVSGGGATASIVVSPASGKTITNCTALSPRGVTIQGVQVGNTWTFTGLNVFGTYSITATNGTNTEVQDVLIDMVGDYNVTINYVTYLFNDGDTRSSITGGWALTSINNTYPYNWNFDTNANTSTYSRSITTAINFSFSNATTNLVMASAHTLSSIDLSPYRKLCCSGNAKDSVKLAVSQSIADSYLSYNLSNATAFASVKNDEYGVITVELDISQVSSGYIFLCMGGYSQFPASGCDINKIWLE